MLLEDPSPDFGLSRERPKHKPLIQWMLFGLGASLFLTGGLFFGAVFLTNWQVLVARQRDVQVVVPGTDRVIMVQVPSLPNVPVSSTLLPGSAQSGSKPNLSLLPDWTDRERLNVLLLGIDHRDDEPLDGSRSDVLMVVSIDPSTRSVVMVSFPRDLWVAIPGYGEQRINVAHSLGGPDLAMRTITSNFGVKIHHYARINFRGFEQVVDTIGGVFVDADRPVKDDEYPTEDYGLMRLYIAPGPQWMDGATALQYARSRHSENDFGRSRRQQKVLMAIRDRAVQANMIFRAPELVPLATKTVSTDFGPLDLVKLAKLSTEIQRERVLNLVIDVNYARPFTTSDGAEVLLPNRPLIQSAIQEMFSRTASLPTPTPVAVPATPTPQPTASPTEAPVPTRVEVLNGTNRSGLARSTADLLTQQGFDVTRVDSADREDYRQTSFFVQPGREKSAAALASALGLPAAAVQPLAPDVQADVRVILGADYQSR